MKVEKLCGCTTGSPQFRIHETLDVSAPVYHYYGQPEVENDLVGMERIATDEKTVRTFDEVNTVSAGDVLFTLISGRATLVRECHDGYLYSQNYVKLMPTSTLHPMYLIYLLNESRTIQRQLKMSLQGSSVMKYTVKQLKEINLPTLPDIAKQQTIGELYFNQLHLQALRERVAVTETAILLGKLKEVDTHE